MAGDPTGRLESENHADESFDDLPSESGTECEATAASWDLDVHDVGVSSRVRRAQEKHESRLLAIDGVEGIGVDVSEIGDEIIVVYVRDAGVRAAVPARLDGIIVRTVVSGELDAL